MSEREEGKERDPLGEDEEVVAAVQNGDASTFSSLAEPHRKELRVHCYRMLGNFEDAEDLVQETFVRAWRGHAAFEGRSTFRAWLYRIATNACLDAIKKKGRRVQVVDVGATTPRSPSFDEVPWLQPFPDELVPGTDEPDSQVVAKETIELRLLGRRAAPTRSAPRRPHSTRRPWLERGRNSQRDRRHGPERQSARCNELGLVCKDLGSPEDLSGRRSNPPQRTNAFSSGATWMRMLGPTPRR